MKGKSALNSRKKGGGSAITPVCTSLPTINGFLVSGQTLTINPGTWTDAITFSYQLNRDGVIVSRSTSYLLTDSDIGHRFISIVTASGAGGTTTAQSPQTAAVIAPPPIVLRPQNLVDPTVSTHTPVVGTEVTGTTGSWTGTPPPSFTYQWKADTTVVGSAINYTPVTGDIGKVLTFTVYATNTAATTSVSAPVTAPVASGSLFRLGINLTPQSGIAFFAQIPTATLDYYRSIGITTGRLPIYWESFQPTLNSALDPTMMGNLTTFLSNASARGMRFIIDIHNFGTFNGNQIGSVGVPFSAFADLWSRLATALVGNPGVLGYDLMNEWHDMPLTTDVFNASQAAINAIRLVDTATNIYIEGTGYSGASTWPTLNTSLLTLSDPSNKLIFSAHQYLDRDSSGTHFVWAEEVAAGSVINPVGPLTTNSGVDRISYFVNMLAGRQGHIGEINCGNDDPNWNVMLDNTLAYIKANNLEVDIWAAGPIWDTSYPFDQDPDPVSGVQSRQMVVLEKYSGYTGPQPNIYALKGPSRGSVGSASTNFTVDYRGKITTAVTITPHAKLMDGTPASGTFSPTSITLPIGSNATGTFVFTPSTTDTIQISTTNSVGWTDPAAIGFSAFNDHFVGLAGTPVNIYAVKRLWAPYIGPAITLQKASGAQQTFYFNNRGDLPRQAIQDFAGSRSIKIIKIFSQNGPGSDLTFTAGQEPTLTLVNGDGYPEVTWGAGNQGNFQTPTWGNTGQGIIARIKHASGDYFISQDIFNGPFRFAPTNYLITNPADNTTVVSLTNTPDANWHTYGGSYKSNTVNGIKFFTDTAISEQGNTPNYTLAPAFASAADAELGFFRFSALSQWAGSWQTLIILNDQVTLAQHSAFANADATYYGVALPDSLGSIPLVTGNPTITGTTANTVPAAHSMQPFSTVVIADPNSGTPVDTVTITPTGTSGNALSLLKAVLPSSSSTQWAGGGGSAATYNVGVNNPDGNPTVWEMVAPSGVNGIFYASELIDFNSAYTGPLTVLVKPGDQTWCGYQANSFGTEQYQCFHLSGAGTVGSIVTDFGTVPTITGASILALTGTWAGWFVITIETTGIGQAALYPITGDGAPRNYTGAGAVALSLTASTTPRAHYVPMTNPSAGVYGLVGAPADVTAALQQIIYSPTGGNGTSETFALGVTGSLGGSASDSNTVITIGNALPEIPYAAPSGTFRPINYKGVNIDGGELNPTTTQPYGYQYFYPQNFELDYFASKGFGIIRFPISTRRTQPISYGNLKTTIDATDPTIGQLPTIKAILDHALALNLRVILEPHEFGAIFDTLSNTYRYIGSDAEATAQWVDWWTRIASKFKNYPNVVWGLENEPNGMTVSQWWAAAQAVTNAIRSVDSGQLILVPGGATYTAAYSWVDSGNAAAALGFTDSANNYMFELHNYLDASQGGLANACAVGAGHSALDAATTWARTYGKKLFLGEFGWSQDSTCPPEATAFVGYMTSNADVWAGWTYWLGGSSLFYGSPAAYSFTVAPVYTSNGPPYTDKPQMAILVANLTPSSGSFDDVAELPRVTPALPSSLTITGTSVTVTTSSTLQTAINNAFAADGNLNHEIVIAAGSTINSASGYTIPAKSGANAGGSGWVIVRSNGTLPATGTRVTSAHAAQLAKLTFTGTSGGSLFTTGSNHAHHFYLQGLELCTTSATGNVFDLIEFGGFGDQTSFMPHDFIIDRCWAHGVVDSAWTSSLIEIRRFLALNCGTAIIIDTSMTEFHSQVGDCQAIWSCNGSGPFLIQNCHLEASTENLLFGGSDPSTPNVLPSDVTIRNCRFSKNPLWYQNNLGYEVKNLIEFKVGQRILVENCVFQTTWDSSSPTDSFTHTAAGQPTAILIDSVNQSGGQTWAVTNDVTFRYNSIHDTCGGLTLVGDLLDNCLGLHRVSVHDNIFWNVHPVANTSDAQLLSYFGKSDRSKLSHIHVFNNTWQFSGAYPAAPDSHGIPQAPTAFIRGGDPPTGGTDFVFNNNIMANMFDYGVINGYTFGANASLNAYFTGYQMTGNVVICNSNYTTANATTDFPSGNFPISSAAGVGWANPNGTSLSDFIVSGTYAAKGANVSAVISRTSGV